MEYFGNKNIIKLYKTAFFCSRKCPADIVLKSLDWAKSKKDKGECIISCFHSRIEKDVFDILLKGTQPLVMVLARGMKKRWPEKIKKAVDQKKLLIVSPFDEKITYITQETANKRNKIMVDIADELFLAYITPNGNLDKLLKKTKHKTIKTFEQKLNSTDIPIVK